MRVKSGVLYIVATPIGNLDDLSPRARTILEDVSLVAAEDTRHSGRLLKHFNIKTRLVSLHDYNEAQRSRRILQHLLEGESVALISDAGTPLISDPGYRTVRDARAAGITVSPIPGACAMIAALSVSGLPTDRFVFEGFLPAGKTARRKRLEGLAKETRTLVFYESVHRVVECLADMAEIMGKERKAVVARELTKLHEAVLVAALGPLHAKLQTANTLKGEVVIVVAGRKGSADDGLAIDKDHLLDILLQELPVKRAASLAAKITGGKKNDFYRVALARREHGPE